MHPPAVLISLLLLATTTFSGAASIPEEDRVVAAPSRQCGPIIGSCPPGTCCSASYTCGTSIQHCGFGCRVPFSHESCSASEPYSRVPYGALLTSCVVPGVVALTFDDGPSRYTEALLDLLDAYGAKATFFVNGRNVARDLDQEHTGWPRLLRRILGTDHQLASHTFEHADLDTLDAGGRWAQMVENERVFRAVLGFAPTYMRPPYGHCGGECLGTMGELGYHVVNWDVDTEDWLHQGDIGAAMGIFDREVSDDTAEHSYVVLAHDIHERTVTELAPFMIRRALAKGYRLVTVGECLGDPDDHWYSDEAR